MNTLSELSPVISGDRIFLFFPVLFFTGRKLKRPKHFYLVWARARVLVRLAPRLFRLLPVPLQNQAVPSLLRLVWRPVPLSWTLSELQARVILKEAVTKKILDSETRTFSTTINTVRWRNAQGQTKHRTLSPMRSDICLFRSLYFALSTNIARTCTGHENYLGVEKTFAF